jgi:hypothetical protein
VVVARGWRGMLLQWVTHHWSCVAQAGHLKWQVLRNVSSRPAKQSVLTQTSKGEKAFESFSGPRREWNCSIAGSNGDQTQLKQCLIQCKPIQETEWLRDTERGGWQRIINGTVLRMMACGTGRISTVRPCAIFFQELLLSIVWVSIGTPHTVQMRASPLRIGSPLSADDHSHQWVT